MQQIFLRLQDDHFARWQVSSADTRTEQWNLWYSRLRILGMSGVWSLVERGFYCVLMLYNRSPFH